MPSISCTVAVQELTAVTSNLARRCMSLRGVRDNDEKYDAFRGICLMIKANPAALTQARNPECADLPVRCLLFAPFPVARVTRSLPGACDRVSSSLSAHSDGPHTRACACCSLSLSVSVSVCLCLSFSLSLPLCPLVPTLTLLISIQDFIFFCDAVNSWQELRADLQQMIFEVRAPRLTGASDGASLSLSHTHTCHGFVCRSCKHLNTMRRSDGRIILHNFQSPSVYVPLRSERASHQPVTLAPIRPTLTTPDCPFLQGNLVSKFQL